MAGKASSEAYFDAMRCKAQCFLTLLDLIVNMPDSARNAKSFRSIIWTRLDGKGVDVKEMTLKERKTYIQAVAAEVAQGKLTLGGAVKRLRENLLGVNQERFAVACKISKRALSQLEVDRGNPTLATLEAVFKKFGLTISLAHLNPADLNAAAVLKSKAGFGIPFPSPNKPI